MPMTSTEMIKLLKKFYNQSTGKSTIVPDHKQELGKDLEHRILKQDGLK